MKKFYSYFLVFIVTLLSQQLQAAPGNALSFDGYDDAVKIHANSAFDFANGTIEAWVKPNVVNATNMCWFANRSASATRYSLHMSANTIGLWNGSSFKTVVLPFSFVANRWYHVAAIIKSTTTDVYVNGVYMGTTGNGMGTATGLQIQIGHPFAGTVSGEAFNGCIDEVKVWNYALYPPNIWIGMYSNVIVNPDTQNYLVGYYKLDQASGVVAPDGGIWGRTGTLMNFSFTGNSNWVESYAMVAPLVTMATMVKANSFTINWTTPVSGLAEKYYLDVSTSANFTSFIAGYNRKDVGNVLSYNITGLAANTMYYFRLSAEKASVSQQGCYSNVEYMTTLLRDPAKVYVDNSRTSGLNNGTSWANAYLKFESGVAAAAGGDSVFVAKGIYMPSANASFSLKDEVKVYGGFSGTETSLSQRILTTANVSVLKGNGTRVMRNEDVYDGTLLDGFTITGGTYSAYEDGGAGILNYSASPVFSNCTITANTTTNKDGGGSGAGMYNVYSSPTILNCLFTNNVATGAGAAIFNYQSSAPQITHCIFTNNTTTFYGGAIASMYGGENGGVEVDGCVFYKNYSEGYGSVAYSTEASMSFTNCTFNGNTSIDGYQGLITTEYGYAGIRNSVIWGNGTTISNINDGYANVSNSIVQGGYADGEDVLNVDPLFVNAAAGAGADGIWGTADDGLQLQATSPAVNIGLNNSFPGNITTDITGKARIYGGTIDLGAYEYQPAPAPVSHIKYVDASRTSGTKTGASWSNAFVKFEDAVTAASAGDTIWVAKGDYKPAAGASFSLKEGVKFYGGFAGDETSFSARTLTAANTTNLVGNNARVVINTNLTNATLIDGFTIKDGYYVQYQSGGAGMCNTNASIIISHCTFTNNKAYNNDGGGVGGGILNTNSSPIISNCVFTNNDVSSMGGGIFNDETSLPQITNSIFVQNNSGMYGGAIVNFGEYMGTNPVIITNCLFYGNSSESDYGTVIFSYSASPVITNCTFVKNTAHNVFYGFGAVTTEYGTTTLNNSIIWGNDGTIQSMNEGAMVVNNSIIEGGYEGSNALDTDPLFRNINLPEGIDGIWGTADDGLRIMPNSPALNKGDNSLLSIGITTDILGNARISGGTVDMGAYEFVAGVLPVTIVSFKATVASNCTVALTWTTATETNSAKYVIEASQSGNNFIAVAEVASKNMASGAAYNYAYNGATNGVVYFRLKMVDKDGAYTYSDVKNATIACNQPRIVVAPNPVKNTLIVYNLQGNSEVKLYTITGQLIQSVITSNTTQTIPVGNLSAGTYLVRILSNGKEVAKEKILKQ